MEFLISSQHQDGRFRSENENKSDLKKSRSCLIWSQSDHIGIQSEIPDNKAGQGYHIGPTFDQIVSK